MKRKEPKWSFLPLLLSLNAALLVCALATWLSGGKIALVIAELVLFAGLFCVTWWRILTARRGMYRMLSRMATQLSFGNSEALSSMPIPVVLLDSSDRIAWYNEVFRTRVLHGHDVYAMRMDALLSEAARTALEHESVAQTEYEERQYTVYQANYHDKDGDYRILYFTDDTELKAVRDEYYRSRPVVMVATIDSINDFSTSIPESEIASMRGAVEKEIETFAVEHHALMRKLSNRRYLLILEERDLPAVIEGRFSVLDRVRALSVGGEQGTLTLSIGVGRYGDTLTECEKKARQALDMALGRGGDQAAVLGQDGYEFFGGVSKGVEKRTKVRTRVIASAMREFIESSDRVLIMGHQFSDLDSLGAAYALWGIATSMDRAANIVLSRTTTLAQPLLTKIDERAAQLDREIVIDAQDALPLLTKRTLVIVVDTHRPSVVESEEIYRAATTVLVVDHHRKTVDYIDNAAVFYHEPYSSSACEMVAELIPYMGQNLVGREEAEGLLSGIMLDTKNYVLKTGVRTFEASAYLRSLGADPVTVRKMFSGSMELYRKKAELVASAEIYSDCAIAVSTGTDTPRVAAAQAADELLSIDGVKASFVLFGTGERISISARSLGEINVQLIMEALGGGGHLTMAAAQLEHTDFSEARQRLIEAIRSNRKDEKA